jgi:hypothetical protein
MEKEIARNVWAVAPIEPWNTFEGPPTLVGFKS